MEIVIDNLQGTQLLAKKLARAVTPRDIILLHGELGAGKTTFTKAFAKAIGVEELVTSPTFAFMREYFGKLKLSHYDMYRVENENELWELGIADNLEEDGVCVIEWNKFESFPSDKRVIDITITKGDGDIRYFDIKGVDFEYIDS